MDDLQTHHRFDPHRRLLRHAYQEGPGFLLLADGAAGHRAARRTWNGPASGSGPLGPPRSEEGIDAALALGVSRASLHGWRVRHEAGGLEALVDRARGPQRVHLPAWVEQALIVVRLLTYWNSKRPAAEFTRREICPSTITPSTVS